MSTTLKVVIGASLVGLVIWGMQAAKNAFADFAYKIVGYGFPQFNSNTFELRLPVRIRFKNPTPIAIEADDVLINVYLLKETDFVHAGVVHERNLSIPPGTTVKEITPLVDLQNIFSGILQTFQTVLHDRKITLRTDVAITYKGIALPVQSSTDNITI